MVVKPSYGSNEISPVDGLYDQTPMPVTLTSFGVAEILPVKGSINFMDEFVTVAEPNFNLGGIYIYDRRFNWDRIYKRDGLGGNGIYALCRIGNYIWAGVYEFDKQQKIEYGKGLFLIHRITRKVIPVDLNNLNISSATILSFHFDGENIWIGTGKGLVRLKIDNKLAEWPGKQQKN